MDVDVRRTDDGVVYMRSRRPLGPYGLRLTDALERWATEAPARTFLAERGPGDEWRRVTYADALLQVRSLAQALLDRQLSVERPILILSGNGIDHGLLALAAMYVGVPYAPIAPAYSLQAKDFASLRQVFDRMRPGLVFAADGAPYERAFDAVVPPEVEIVVSHSPPAARRVTAFEDLGADP